MRLLAGHEVRQQGDIKNAREYLLKHPNGRDHLGDLSIDGSIILKLITKKQEVLMYERKHSWQLTLIMISLYDHSPDDGDRDCLRNVGEI